MRPGERSTRSGIGWATVSQFGQQAVGFVATLVMTRLLAPADFGLLGMALVVVGFARIFKDLGTASAVIQHRAPSPALLSSLFWINLAFGLLTTLAIAAAAPAVAALYGEPRIAPILRALSLTFLISSLGILQQGLLERALAFDRLARIELAASVAASGVGIAAALLGHGLWSLVYQALTAASAATILLWLASPWRPRPVFARAEVRAVGGYSLNLTGFNIVNYTERNLDNLLIGTFLGAGALGYYALAYRLMLYPLQSVAGVIGRVLFPTYARLRDDDARFRQLYLQATGAVATVTLPVFFGLIAAREPLILAIFGARWQPVVPLIPILGFVGMAQSVGTLAGMIYRARGRTDWQLRFGVATTALSIPAFALGLRWGVIGVAVAYAAVMAALLYPSFAIPLRLIGLRVADLGAILWRPFTSGALMCAGVTSLNAALAAALPPLATLVVLVPSGVALYAAASWLLNREQLRRTMGAAGWPWPMGRAGGPA